MLTKYILYIFLFMLIILSTYFFVIYNRNYIKKYIKLHYPDEYITLNINPHPMIYIFPVIILIAAIFYIYAYPVLFFKSAIIIGILLILMLFFSLVSLSTIFCATNQRIIKLSSLIYFNKLINNFDVIYKNIKKISLYKYAYSTEILLKDKKNKIYRISSISNINFIYNVCKKMIKEKQYDN